MACGLIYLEYLRSKGCFKKSNLNLLDIGSQNLLGADLNRLYNFINSLPGPKTIQRDRIEKLVERAVIGPGIETTYLSEIFENTSVQYESLDVAPGKKTTIFDLNTESISSKMKEKYHLVVNFGTTEHVFNQFNAFKIIHEATACGGNIFHQVPAIGYLGHCYFLYTKKFFAELAEANEYNIIDMWLTGPQGFEKTTNEFSEIIKYRDSTRDVNHHEWTKCLIPNGALNCLLQKTKRGPFKVNLEVNTSHSKVNADVLSKYSTKQASWKKLLLKYLRLKVNY